MSREHEEERKNASNSTPTAEHSGAVHDAGGPAKDTSHLDRIWGSEPPAPKPAYYGDAVSPMLYGMANELDRKLAEVDIENDTQEHRAQVIEAASTDLSQTSIMLVALLDDPMAKKETARYRVLANRTAASIGKLLRFVRTRAPHKDLEERFMGGVGEFNKVLTMLGTPDVESRDAATLSERAVNSAKAEETGVGVSEGEVRAALKGLHTREKEGLNTFYELARQADIEEPPFVEELLKAALIATLSVLSDGLLEVAIAGLSGHGAAEAVEVGEQAIAHAASAGEHAAFHGAGTAVASAEHAATHAAASAVGHAAAHGGGAVGELATGGGGHASEMLKKLLSTMSEEVIQVQVEKGGKHGDGQRGGEKEEPSKIDQKQRALTFFWSRLCTATDDRYARYERTLNKMVTTSAVSKDELSAMASTLAASESPVSDRIRKQSSLSWATYLAQSHLGTHYAGNNKVANMADYFGKQQENGRAFGTNRSGGEGVLSIRFEVDHPGDRPLLDREFTKVTGLNSELKKNIVEQADHRFGNVPLPKEVHVQCRFAHAIIALDEANRIRDVWNWHEVEPYVGESAATFWKHWGGTEMEIK